MDALSPTMTLRDFENGYWYLEQLKNFAAPPCACVDADSGGLHVPVRLRLPTHVCNPIQTAATRTASVVAKRSTVERKTIGNMKSGCGLDSMIAKNASAGDGGAVQRHLRELIAALDRRVPHLERVDEVEIARAAADLRKKAEQRLTEIESEGDESNWIAAQGFDG